MNTLCNFRFQILIEKFKKKKKYFLLQNEWNFLIKNKITFNLNIIKLRFLKNIIFKQKSCADEY